MFTRAALETSDRSTRSPLATSRLRCVVVAVAGIIACAMPAESSDNATQRYEPPWVLNRPRRKDSPGSAAEERGLSVGRQIVRTNHPLRFRAYESSFFKNAEDAERFAAKQGHLLQIKKLEAGTVVSYGKILNLTSLIEPGEREYWSSGKLNYWLYCALLRTYRNHDGSRTAFSIRTHRVDIPKNSRPS